MEIDVVDGHEAIVDDGRDDEGSAEPEAGILGKVVEGDKVVGDELGEDSHLWDWRVW